MLIGQAFILLVGIYFTNAGYGIPAQSGGYTEHYGQSDVEAPAYVPAHLNNNQYPRPSYPRHYSGTKTYSGRKTYSGTKTAYSGTKTAYPGTKTAYSGTKTSYGHPSRYSEGSKTWHGDSGEVNYTEFSNNANKQFVSKCDVECKNNGICVDTNTCSCPVNYYGQYCEFEKKPCLNYPPLPMNSMRKCSSDMCMISCMEGHKFIDGTSVANMKCVNGDWQPTRADLTSIPDCEPECNPPCLNGGVCLGINTCQCPMEYRGPQCQYASNVCDVRKLAFNGGYSCFGDAEKFSCRLNCPSGAIYSTPPADVYTCLYSTGTFQPQPIPHCVFNDVVIITPQYNNYHNKSYSHTHSEASSKESTDHSTAHSARTFDESTGKYGGSKTPVHVVVQDYTPKGGSCLTWAGVHYKTFDGQIYSFQSACQHILVREAKEHKYMIAVKQGKCKTPTYCPTELTVYLEDKPYILSVGEEGSVIFRNTKRLIPIPASLPGIRVSMPRDNVLVNLDALGVTIKWDTNNLVAIEGSVLLWNNTEGLCGRLDGDPNDDLMTKEGAIANTKIVLASSWQTKKIEDVCESSPTEKTACASKSDEDMKKALQFCTKIFSQPKFKKCSKIMDVSLLLEACQWDYCACNTSESPEDCACNTVSVYAKECLRHGVEETRNWRDSETCPMKCPEGKIYQSCGADTQPSCSFPTVPSKPDNDTCVEGCFCPEGLLLDGGRCVPKSECPCRLRNKNFKPGSVIPKDCNTCTCESGAWRCTQVPCGARCGTVGDPHYTTFDGLRYDFMGHCTYTLLQTDGLNIDVENVACSGSISEEMNLTPSKGEGKPSCTKAVTLNSTGVSIHLRQGGMIFVNGTEIRDLPVMVGNIKIRAASSLFLIVQLPNKVDLWWDGNTRVFVDVPPEFHDKTKGLCGTFNLNQKDDFLTPENDIEQSALAFANKWKTREFCSDIDLKEPEHPCKANVENKETAEKYCSKLKSKLFESCHWYVDVEPFYEECLYDMCACTGDVSRCLCPILGDYAMSCAKAGVMVQWRYNVKECELSCSGGQEYTVCADSCLRKCSDTSLETIAHCKPTCVEGCACPPGQLLDDSGMCVPVGLCPCYSKLGSQTTVKFNAGYKEVRPGRRERELCTCVGARWDCVPATPEDIQNYPPAEELRANCSVSNNMEFTTCETSEPLTCKNMHLPPTSTSLECKPGCQCKRGYVMDMLTKKCILPAECPCHHGGRSYNDGHSMQEECNRCECKSGSWDCTKNKCAGICSAWGDSHVTTFDGTDYDFEGVCTYLLAKGMKDSKDGFDVEIQNVPCGSTGATCSKSVTLKVGGDGSEETVSLTKNIPLPDISMLERIKLRMAGAYIFLDVPSLGLSLQWDRGVRVYVKVDSMWRGRLKGLCGNYNNDRRDDFQSPSGGGLAESSSLLFADSWKLKSTCPKPTAVEDHCKQRPQRKEWAIAKCGAMKRYPFTLCHTEVPPTAFVERCERDACACDSGDDCECACTALAAYAYACAHRGVTFKWRTQQSCPMQCDEECSNYNECVPACPLETCENTLYFPEIKTNCESETCVEGCKPKKSCPEGEVYKNISSTECVPRAKCKPVCMTLDDGTEVLEGEVIEEDPCHTCRCSKKTKVCSGQPCLTELPQIGSSEFPRTAKPHDEPLKCVTGWTDWLSRTAPEIGSNGESIEKEPLPEPNELVIGSPMCTPDMMKKIECRTVKDHKTPKETGMNVECSLERGLVCNEVGKTCPDFEIRVDCECAEPTACVNSDRPSEPHPTDCTKFYECAPDGVVLKDCGPGTMYNTQTMVCEWPKDVIAVRPECLVATTLTTKVYDETTHLEKLNDTEGTSTSTPSTTTSSTTTTTSRCPPGQEFVDCMYPCDKTCNHFKTTLMAIGKCSRRDDCVGGCIDAEVAKINCNYGSLWRDERTCVPLKDCTCEYNGQQVKPGGVVVDGCMKCQCLDNELHCDASDCVSVVTPKQGSTHESYIFTPPIPESITISSTVTSTTLTPTTVTTASTPTTVPSTTVTLTTPTPKTTASTTLGTTPGKEGREPFFTTTAKTTVESTPIIVKTTVSPPPECAPDSYIDLMFGDQPLPNTAFTASSYASESFMPQYSKLNGRPVEVSAGSWNPSTADKEQYIQVELPRSEPIYGVKVQGSPIFSQWVTSYEILHSNDGVTFATVEGPDGKPKVFRGPIDHNEPMKQMIEPPIDAKFIRLHPLTWHDDIAVRWELIGCEEPTMTETTRVTITTLSPLECTEPLGLAAELPLENIQVSSNDELKKHLSLNSEKGWKPLYSTPGEWIMFDFTSPRNITGVKTKGGAKGWVSAYKIFYTSDLDTFNPVVDETGAEKLFPGNFDKDSVVLNEFRPPIHAQYLKIMPVKSKDNIEMRIEPIGCFEPYPVTETTVTEPSTVTESSTQFACQLCPGVQPVVCDCTAEAPFFDGENCVTKDQCPCMEGFMSYPVGSQFIGADCKECVCKLGGTVSCKPVKTCDCAPNLVPKLTDSCECTCSPCPPGTKICPTSKLCLALEKWCDGLQDCPDDEKDCTTTVRTTVTEPTIITTVVPTEAATLPTTTTVAPTTTAERNRSKPPIHKLRKNIRKKVKRPKHKKQKVVPNLTAHSQDVKSKPHKLKTEICPVVKCPPGYIIQYTTPSKSSYSSYSSDLPPPRPRVSYQRYYRGGYTKGGRGGYSKGGFSKGGYTKSARPGFSKGGYNPGPYTPPQQNQGFNLDKPTLNNPSVNNTKQECPQYKCIPKLPPFRPGSTPAPVPCSVVSCPPTYTLRLEKVPTGINQCPQYECVPPPERPAFCNVTGRTFNTFDGSEYKYDVCYHILARENRFDAWAIVLRKASYNSKNELLLYQDDQRILVKPNMMIEYDNYEYTVEQTSKICFQKNSFDVNRLGNGIAIKSRKYNFTVLYTNDGDVKIGVLKTHLGTVDGMCGAYDGNPRNDRRLPDGRLAKSISEFGQGWAKPGLPRDACEVKVIPPVQQKKCWDMCDVITKEPLSQCGTVLNLDKWRHICLEKVCECAEAKNNATRKTEEECRCQLLETLVAECLAADKNIDVASWRMLMECQADCPAPLVHYDCYRKRCEPTCASIGAVSSCPVEDGQCFPGCYCPEGKLRKGDQCVVPADCLDCTCTGVGTPAKYTTFEGDDLPFLANCTYLASRDRNDTNQHKYEVYSTNGPCEDSDAVCTNAVHFVYEKNVLHITKDGQSKKLLASIGEKAIYKYPAKMPWGTISLTNGHDIIVVLPDIHIELTVSLNKMEFHVNVPSFLYGNQTEGLCGVCAGYQDVLITSNGTTTDNIDEYGKSWEATAEALKTLGLEEEKCEQAPPPETCITPIPETNPCYNLYNADKFGACLALVDPQPFMESCEADLCMNATDSCVALERYAAACRAQGICLNDWRVDLCPYPCEEPLVYRPCVDCERTCDNYDELKRDPEKCTNKPVEGCFCPEGKVRVNNTCIEPSKCFPCDAKKEHYAGDEWHEDACTKCECSKLTGENTAHISCTKQSCTTPVCSETEDLVEKPLAAGQCCAEYMCVPKPVKNCTEPKKMECGYGQVLKQKTTPNGCNEFACECKPASECPSIPEQEDVEILEPGMERLVDDSGCCPRLQFLCKVENCPQPPECPEFNTAKAENVSGKCCPEHTCVPPKDKCIVTLEWEAAAKGGEKARTKPQTLLKDLDAAWADGPCRSCRCESSSLGPMARCTATECPAIGSTDQFIVEPHPLPFYCCPVPVQVACRDGDKIYKVGENWTSTENVCEKYKCEEVHEGKLERVKTEQHCDEDCQPGWKYFPAEKESGQCCGKCLPVACVVGGVERPIGEKWHSEDFCTNYTCVNVNGTLQVDSSSETCPKVPKSEEEQFSILVTMVVGQCCPKVERDGCISLGKVYKEGETWTLPLSPCTTTNCSRDSNGILVQKESTEQCVKECKRGWKYQEPPLDVCCGSCVQEYCVIGDELKKPGTAWNSADNCTTFTCEKLGDEVYITSAKEMCPDVSDCPPENLVNDTCCLTCKITADNLSKCVPVSIPSSETVGLIRVRKAHRGLCVNQNPVKGFKECRGTCDSGTLFNNATGSHDSNCECCQAKQYAPVLVEVTCQDGTVHDHRVASPLACACLRCGEPAAPMWPTKHYSGTKTPQKPNYGKEREELLIPDMYQRFGGASEKPRL